MGVQLDASGGGDKRVKPNINVTPLVDVVLVLLIIFMLVIPNMQAGVPIDLFKANNAIKDEEDAEPITVTLALSEGGEDGGVAYHLEDEALTRDALVARLAKLHAEDPSKPLMFRGDSRIEYGKVRDVFHECQNMGFAAIQMAVGAQKEGWQED